MPEVLLADADLPGVDEDAMSLREALRLGGARTITILGLLGALQLMDGGVFNVLAPDIQKSLRVSDAVLGAIGGATGVLFVLGAIPMSSLSDRTSRKRLIAITMSVWAVVIALTGAVQNAFQMFLARFGAGLGQSAQLPVERAAARRHVSDRGAGARVRGARWRPGRRARCVRRSSPAGSPRSPAATNGWRWAFVLLGLVALPDCPVGQHDQGTAAGPVRDAIGARRGAATGGERAPDLALGRVRAAAEDPELLLLPRRHGCARLRPLHRAAVPQPVLRRRARSRRVPARRDRDDHRDPDPARDRGLGPARGRAVPAQPARRDGLRRPARRVVRHRTGGRDLAAEHLGGRARARAGDGVRAGRVHDPPRGRVDDHPLPAPRAWHRDDRHLRVPVRFVLRRGAHRSAERRVRDARRARRSSCCRRRSSAAP